MALLYGLYWWIDRWRRSSAYMSMTLEQQGAYRNLLDEAWLRDGVLPADEELLAKACGDPRKWRYVREAVMAHFEAVPGGWRNVTLDEVRHQSVRRARNQANYRARAAGRPITEPVTRPLTLPITDPVTRRTRVR